MNVFQKVTFESLKKNRTRTFVTIIGIMLSTALICAVTTSVSSVIDFGRRYFAYESGSWHGMTDMQSYETFEEISDSDRVDSAVYYKYEGYVSIDSQNPYKPYIYVVGASDNFEDIMPVHIVEGHYPANDDEILIPEHISEEGGVSFNEGEKVTFEVGDRIKNGHAVGQDFEVTVDVNDEVVDEEFVPRYTKEYTVCGVYERPVFESYDVAGYTAIVKASDEEIIPDSYSIYFSMKDPDDVYDFMSDMKLEGETNTELLMFTGVTKYSTFKRMIYNLSAIVIGLIMFGSIMLIYNAFSISVSERTKQFGLLSSVGATQKQLRKMVRFESFLVSAVGIPLGILLGIIGMWVTFTWLGGNFTSYIGDIGDSSIRMKLSVSFMSLLSAVVIAFATIRISAWIPSRRATKISAVEAIRLNSDVKTKKKKIKTPKIVYKLFGISGMLGHKYYKRSKKKYRTTILSLFMSIVLFVSASAFTDYLVNSIDATSDASGHDIEYCYHPDEENEIDETELLERFRSLENIDSASLIEESSVMCSISIDSLNKKLIEMYMLDFLVNFNNDAETALDNGDIDMFVIGDFVDDETYDRILKEYGIKKEDLTSEGIQKGIVFDGGMAFDMNSGRYVNGNILECDECTFECYSYKDMDEAWFDEENGDGTATYRDIDGNTFTVPLEECKTDFTLETAKTIHEKPFYSSSNGLIWVVYPMSSMDEVWNKSDESFCMNYVFNSSEPDICYKEIYTLLKDENLPNNELYNLSASEKSKRSFVSIIKVFAYGFIVLISMIAAANVFNTISTNIGLRRREFAMLRSIGMTHKGIRRILNYECVLYGVKSLVTGLPVSAVVTYFIFKAVNITMETVYYLPWKAIGIAAFSVFAVVFATMIYSMNKLKKDNPIDALKNENL